MTQNATYSFCGSWTQHSYGYNALCERSSYAGPGYTYSGIVTAQDGHVWTFHKTENQNPTIKELADNSIVGNTSITGIGDGTLTGGLSALNSKITNFLVVDTSIVSSPPTFNANTHNYVDFPTVKTGYLRLGLIGITGSGNTNLVIQEFYNVSGAIRVYLRNLTNSDITPNSLTAYVLYIKD